MTTDSTGVSMRIFRHVFRIVFFLLLPAGISCSAFASGGISITGQPEYAEGFRQFGYVSAEAEKGGTLVLYSLGSFDKLNPYSIKGAAPLGVGVLVFETLGQTSLDEPFSKYGLLADDISVAEDLLSMTVHVDPDARFSDGSPVTAEDVVFSVNMMKSDRVHPLYPSYYRDLSSCTAVDSETARFTFAVRNRELPLIALEIPVFSKNFYDKNTFGEEDIQHPGQALLGSGPYTIERAELNRLVSYQRNDSYWAKDKNVRKGMFNFDTINVKYYKDQTVALEGFKAGDFDVYYANIAKQWARDMTGAKFDSGAIIKEKFPHSNSTGMQCFVFNTRKEIFKDRKVREALNIAFDFDWINNALFFGQYVRNESFFSNSYLAARGLPGELELSYLNPYKESLPAEVFTTPLSTTRYLSKQDTRKNLRQAANLLKEAGWKIADGQLKNSRGEPFVFEILLDSPMFNRVIAPYEKNLARLGITIRYRVVDPALYMERIRRFDFDMVINSFGQSLSPGNEQKNYWSSDAAVTEGSGNLAGIQSPVVDDLVKNIIYSEDQEHLVAAVKALDRVLWYGYYVIPNWHTESYPLAFANKFNRPETVPLYYNYFQLLMTWWAKAKTSYADL